MNINDLPQGSYSVVSTPTNINQLPQGSYSVIPPTTTTPSTNLAAAPTGAGSLFSSQGPIANFFKNTWNTYKSAVTSPSTAGSAGDLGSILNEGQRQDQSTSANPVIRTGENALAMTAGTLNTIFAPFGAAAKSITDRVSQDIEQSPAIMNSPIMGKIADFVTKAQGDITNLTQQHPEAARNLANSIGVIVTALSGKAGGEEGLGLFPKQGLDTPIGSLQGIQDAIVNKTANLPDTMQGIQEKITKATAPTTPEDIALKNATPSLKQLPSSVREDLLQSGQINPQTALKGGTIKLTPEETSIITKNADLFQGKTPVDNYYNVDNRITEDNASIGKYLKDKGATFNRETLKSDMLKATTDITDQTNSKAFNVAKQKAIDSIINSVGTVKDKAGNIIPSEASNDLLDARQTFDRANSAKLQSLFSGNDAGKNMFVKAIRDVMNKTISDSIDDNTYSATMKEESGLINIRDNYLLPKAKATMTTSQLASWIKNTPGVSQAIKLGKLTGLVELIAK